MVRRLDEGGASRAGRTPERARRQDEIAAKRRPWESELRALEKELATLEAERAAIDMQLLASATPGSKAVGPVSLAYKRRAEIEARIAAAEARWYEAQQAIEELNNA
jgi:chromosome segregation ATPase